MKIVAEFDFNNGKSAIERHYHKEFEEIISVIDSVNADECKTKVSTEKTMAGKILYSPKALNTAFSNAFNYIGWNSCRIDCEYIYGNYFDGYQAPEIRRGAFREIDFIKEGKKLGIEVQFGKYAFMVYNVCAKMTIFKNAGVIDTGIEIVPVKRLVEDMSTGVSYFEQFAWDLTQRGVSNIDIPVLVLGIDADQ
jgi:hypothetical protein